VTTTPTVTSETPTSGATGVVNSTAVTATFNESVVGSSITTSDYVLKDPNNNIVTATVSYTDSNHTATLTPSAPLASSTKYTATISGVKDASGNTMTSPFIWSFTTAAPTSSIGDPGFEQVQVGAGKFQYRPTGSPWTFAGNSGISANNSGFTSGNPPAPQGTQVAFLQGTGSFSQPVTNWAAGSYTLTFYAAQRANYQASRQDFNVQVDGVVIGTFTPSSTSYQSFTTAVFTVTAGAHTITFQGLDTAGGDNTAFIDQVVASSS
jgi:hypothetical protein